MRGEVVSIIERLAALPGLQVKLKNSKIQVKPKKIQTGHFNRGFLKIRIYLFLAICHTFGYFWVHLLFIWGIFMHFGVNVMGDIRGSFFIFDLFQNYICCRFGIFAVFGHFCRF